MIKYRKWSVRSTLSFLKLLLPTAQRLFFWTQLHVTVWSQSEIWSHNISWWKKLKISDSPIEWSRVLYVICDFTTHLIDSLDSYRDGVVRQKMLGIIWESVRICDSSWKICYPNHRRTSDPFPIPTSCCATFLPSSADNKIWVQDWRKFQFWKMRRRNWVDRLPQMIVCFVQKDLLSSPQ